MSAAHPKSTIHLSRVIAFVVVVSLACAAALTFEASANTPCQTRDLAASGDDEPFQWVVGVPDNLRRALGATAFRRRAALGPGPAEHLADEEEARNTVELPVYASQSALTSTSMLEPAWQTCATSEFGYAIAHPATWQPREQAEPTLNALGGVPSNLWFGERIQIITRIPPLPGDTLASVWGDATEMSLPQGLQVLRLERRSEPIGGGTSRTIIEYLIRGDGADYVLAYHPIGAATTDEQEMDGFEVMVQTFTVLPNRTYTPPLTVQSAETDGFDFPVDPRDGSSGRSPWYASYNVQNPYLSDWSSCYGRSFSELQHAGEDWFRNAGSNVYAVANGRVIWSDPNANYPGGVVIVEHTLPSGVSPPWGGDLIYSMYGHLASDSLISAWTDVQRGQAIGRVHDWGSNSHVHFEMRRYGNMGQAPEWVNGCYFCNTSWPGPGYTDKGCHPDWFGYTHPSNWIDAHRPGADEGCSAPSLNSPGDGHVSSDHTVTFDWSPPPDCDPDGYTFRVKTVSDMDAGGTTLFDEGQGGTQVSKTFEADWEDTDLYWSVRACKPCTPYNPGPWAPPRRFRIEPGSPPPDCPQSGGMILYKHNNYDCGGEGEGSGYVMRSTTGWQNVPGSFNDQASSLKLPSGWSVKLFEHSDRNGASVCRSSDDSDFSGDSYDGGLGLNDTLSSFELFDNGSCSSGGGDTVTIFEHPDYQGTAYGWHDAGWFDVPDYMNDVASSIRIDSGWSVRVFEHIDRGGGKRCYNATDANFTGDTFDNGLGVDSRVSSVEIYHQEDCPDPPDVAFLIDPPDDATLDEDEDITLSWDSCGGATAYYARLWGGPEVDITSGWVESTDWHVGQQWPGTYEWQVKARNAYGESGWSSTRSLTVVESDTTPPTGGITWPLDGATITGCPFMIETEVSDDQSGVSYVEFHAGYDGSWHHLGNDYSGPPYSWNWGCRSVDDQGIWLTIHVWDEAGNEAMDPGGYVYITLDRPSAPVYLPLVMNAGR